MIWLYFDPLSHGNRELEPKPFRFLSVLLRSRIRRLHSRAQQPIALRDSRQAACRFLSERSLLAVSLPHYLCAGCLSKDC